MVERHDEAQMPRAGSGRLSGQELSAVCQKIFDSETRNGLIQGRDYQINLQKGKHPNQADQDTAPDALITTIGQNVLRRDNFRLFHTLLDNYTRSTGIAETVTAQEEGEISAFLDGVLKSGPMQIAHDCLAEKGLVARSLTDFKSQLYQMWFRLYTREARNDTCGFEHVFVGESKKGEISGLHNWLQFYNLEQERELNYRGYIFPKRMGGNDHTSDVSPYDLILSMQFNIAGRTKEVSSFWLGTSPAFELALYTLCFVGGLEENIIQLESQSGRYEVEIRCYSIKSKYGDKIGSAFPVLLAKHPGQDDVVSQPLPPLTAPKKEYTAQHQQNYPSKGQQTSIPLPQNKPLPKQQDNPPPKEEQRPPQPQTSPPKQQVVSPPQQEQRPPQTQNNPPPKQQNDPPQHQEQPPQQDQTPAKTRQPKVPKVSSGVLWGCWDALVSCFTCCCEDCCCCGDDDDERDDQYD